MTASAISEHDREHPQVGAALAGIEHLTEAPQPACLAARVARPGDGPGRGPGARHPAERPKDREGLRMTRVGVRDGGVDDRQQRPRRR